MSQDDLRSSLGRRLSREEWNAAVPAGTPPLPWRGPRGDEIRSIVLMPIPECAVGTTLVFLDAEGRAVEARNDGPIFRAVQRLRPAIGEQIFLPETEPVGPIRGEAAGIDARSDGPAQIAWAKTSSRSDQGMSSAEVRLKPK